MEENNGYCFTRIRENVYQIADDKSVCCTLVKGKEIALLVDTGYGVRNLRAFVEHNVTTPYIVFNSHGHPDHIGGNFRFDEVYAVKEEWDVMDHFEKIPGGRTYVLKEIKVGDVLDLGGLHAETVSLKGHTKASCGVLLKEERLLIAGDAVNEGLWLFNYGCLSMQGLHDSLLEMMKIDFDTYLCGHSHQEYHKQKITSHIENIESLKVDENTLCRTLGFDTYVSDYDNKYGHSSIIFTKEVL